MASFKSDPGMPPANLKSLSPCGEILDSLVVLASTAAGEQLEDCAKRMGDAMLKASESGTDSRFASLNFNAGNLIKKNAYPFQIIAISRIEAAIRKELQILLTPKFSMHEKIDGTLTLVSYEEMEHKLSLASQSRPFEQAHADELTTLNARLAQLLGRPELSLVQSPFRPEIFLMAVVDAWREFNPDPETYDLALPLLQPEVFLDLGPILRGLNDELVACGVIPDMDDSYRIKKANINQDSTKQETRASTAIEQQLRNLFSPAPTAQQPQQVQQLQQTLQGHSEQQGQYARAETAGSGLQGQGPMQATVGNAQLLGYLAALQKTGLEHHSAAGLGTGPLTSALLSNIKSQAPQGSLSRVDENTIDLLAKVFDVVFRDRNIPSEIKNLISFLQVPVLKAALVDKEFFFKEEHPARRMIDVLTKSSAGWDQNKGQDDPLYQTIKRNVDRVQQDIEQQSSVFSDVVSDLESFMHDEEASATAALAEPINEALKKEKIGKAAKAAKGEVALRIGTGEVVAFVETFLEDKWVPVLTLAYSVKDDKPEAVESAVKTMDDLIWSVKPKVSMEQRKELIAKLPGLLARLNKWLNLVKLDDTERLQFFAELAECHASIVRAPLDISPQRQLEISIEVAKQAAERRQQRLAKLAEEEPEPEPVLDEAVDRVQKLERGTWFEFVQKDGGIKKVRLAWVSPLRTLFIFSTGDKLESFSLSAEDLAQAFRDKRALPMWLGGLVGRALTEALESVGANDDSMQQTAAA